MPSLSPFSFSFPFLPFLSSNRLSFVAVKLSSNRNHSLFRKPSRWREDLFISLAVLGGQERQFQLKKPFLRVSFVFLSDQPEFSNEGNNDLVEGGGNREGRIGVFALSLFIANHVANGSRIPGDILRTPLWSSACVCAQPMGGGG